MGEGVSRIDFVGVSICAPTGSGRHIDINFTRDLNVSAPEEWRGDIDQLLFLAGYFKEFIFFHKASSTLIVTDTIINLELDKISEPWRTAAKLAGMYHPYGQIFFGMRLPLLFQRGKAKSAIGKIHSWQAQRIVLSHVAAFMHMPMKSSKGYSEGRFMTAVHRDVLRAN
jgi:hypothetical protein